MANYNCWNCGKRGTHDVGSTYGCLECEVTWVPWATVKRALSDRVPYAGNVVWVVDFDDPAAISSPA